MSEETLASVFKDKKDVQKILDAMGNRSFRRFILDSADLWLNLKDQYMKGGNR